MHPNEREQNHTERVRGHSRSYSTAECKGFQTYTCNTYVISDIYTNAIAKGEIK